MRLLATLLVLLGISSVAAAEDAAAIWAALRGGDRVPGIAVGRMQPATVASVVTQIWNLRASQPETAGCGHAAA